MQEIEVWRLGRVPKSKPQPERKKALAEQRIAAIELRTSVADVVVALDGGEVAPVALGTEMPYRAVPTPRGAREVARARPDLAGP